MYLPYKMFPYSRGIFKVEGSVCAENRATRRKSTRKMDNSGPFLVDLLHCHSLSIPIILHTHFPQRSDCWIPTPLKTVRVNKKRKYTSVVL
jgi:hypothetical protein